MIIAVPSEGNSLDSKVAEHFGRCPFFIVITVKENKVQDFKAVANPFVENHRPYVVVEFIAGFKPDYVLCDGIGPRAINSLNQQGIKVIKGCSGSISEVVNSFLENKLTDSANPCKHLKGE